MNVAIWASRATPVALLSLVFASSFAAAGALVLPPILSDGVIFQRGQPIRLWGEGPPGEKITATLAGVTQSTQSGKDGRWAITLPARNAIEGDLFIRSTDGESQTIREPLLGQVWLCGGQSNMAMPLRSTDGFNEMAPTSDAVPPMHLYRAAAGRPTQHPQAWQLATAETASEFSALCYLIGRGLVEKLREPVGLIDVSIGGTPIDAWAPSDGTAEWDVDKSKYSPRLRTETSYAFEAAVRSVTPFSAKGLIWYQGEADASRIPTNFASRTSKVLMAWRAAFEQPDLPVIAVQLPGNTAAESLTGWRAIQTEQKKLGRILPNASVVENSDLSFDRLHPKYKLQISRRILDRLLSRVYPE